MSGKKISNFHKYRQGDLLISLELSNEIMDGNLDYTLAKYLVDETVKIVDDAILRAANDSKV